MSEKKKTYWWLWLAASAVIGFFAFGSSPLMNITVGDSAIFAAAGQGILSGKLLYADLFDHKGPLIFMIDAAGQLIHGGLTGIWIVEVLFLFVSLLFLWRAVSLLAEKPLSFFVMFCYISYTIWLLEIGNSTELYSVPFSAAALYFSARVFTDEAAEVKPIYGFGLGAGFATLVLMRATNAVIIVGVTAMLVLMLLIQKNFKTLFLNALTFLGGAALISVPLCIYFAANEAFYDFLYGTFLFNVLYSNQATWQSLFQHHKFMLWLAATAVAGLAGGICYSVGRNRTLRERVFGIGIFCLTPVACLAECMSKHAFQHYLLIGAPLSAIGLAMVCGRLAPRLSKRRTMLAVTAAGCVLALAFGVTCIHDSYKRLADMKPMHDMEKANSLELAESIPIEDRNSVWAYNVDANWYFYNRINPCFRYYVLQDWMSVSDPEITRDILKMLDDSPPKWIVALNRDTFGKTEVMQKITENYEIAAENDWQRLYRRK